MYKTPLIKHTPKTISKQTSQQKCSRQNSSGLNFYHKSMSLYNKNKNHDQSSSLFLTHTIKQQSKEVLKQLSVSYLYAICQNFQDIMYQCVQSITKEFLTLEYKIAECQKKFNAIQIFLHKKSKEISTIMQENRTLIELNKDIQNRIANLKQKYQASQFKIKNQWLGAKVDGLRNQLIEYQYQSKKNDIDIKGIKQKLRREIQKLEQISNQQSNNWEEVSKILKQIIEILYESKEEKEDRILIGWRQKIMENIDLKFEILKLREEIKKIAHPSQQSKHQ